MAEEVDQTALIEELEQFRKEKERIRHLVGQIGGKHSQKHDHVINIVFIVAMSVLLILDVSHHFFHLSVPIPSIFSVELAVLLVSVKIIWMIHKSSKVEHFQFWVLNSIEFRLNDLSRHIRDIEKKLSDD
ncbi:MAG: hypothetical protein OEL75_00175 [Kiritimatiellaceae bacterium]|nr:hypothetical protein [Kiritimatiellaceae bacterium]